MDNKDEKGTSRKIWCAQGNFRRSDIIYPKYCIYLERLYESCMTLGLGKAVPLVNLSGLAIAILAQSEVSEKWSQNVPDGHWQLSEESNFHENVDV